MSLSESVLIKERAHPLHWHCKFGASHYFFSCFLVCCRYLYSSRLHKEKDSNKLDPTQLTADKGQTYLSEKLPVTPFFVLNFKDTTPNSIVQLTFAIGLAYRIIELAQVKGFYSSRNLTWMIRAEPYVYIPKR